MTSRPVGFYFDSFDDYTKKVSRLKNEYGDTIEEFEIQFIDGDDLDSALAKAWDLTQLHISTFF